MDFTLNEEQQAVQDLAEQIFAGSATAERVKEVEAGTDRVDRRLWAQLAEANLLGIALPEAVGGSGLGILELALLLEQQGRRVAPVPLLATLVMAALADRRVRHVRAAGGLVTPGRVRRRHPDRGAGRDGRRGRDQAFVGGPQGPQRRVAAPGPLRQRPVWPRGRLRAGAGADRGGPERVSGRPR